MARLWKYVLPQVDRGDLRPMLGVAILGGLCAGLYGAAHDQLTYAISTEYFTNLKFRQFHYADLGLGDRVFAGTVGFIAGWWAGLVMAWFLARRFLPRQPRWLAYRQLRLAFSCVLVGGVLCGLLGYVYGLWRGPAADYSAWEWAIEKYRVTAPWAFVRVAYIHNATYLGGALGLLAALGLIRPVRKPAGG